MSTVRAAPARVVSRAIANRQVAGSDPPEGTGNFCDSAHIRPVVAIPETPTNGAIQQSSLKVAWFTEGPPPCIVQRVGIGPCVGISHFHAHQAADCA